MYYTVYKTKNLNHHFRIYDFQFIIGILTTDILGNLKTQIICMPHFKFNYFYKTIIIFSSVLKHEVE